MEKIKDRVLEVFLMGVVLVLGYVGYVHSEGSITQSVIAPSLLQQTVNKMTLDWTSDANGMVSGIDTSYAIDGLLLRVTTIPDLGGGTEPSDNYDLTLSDSDGVDVLLGLGANEPNSASNSFVPLLDMDDGTNYLQPIPVKGKLELDVTNAGNAKGGKVILYWK